MPKYNTTIKFLKLRCKEIEKPHVCYISNNESINEFMSRVMKERKDYIVYQYIASFTTRVITIKEYTYQYECHLRKELRRLQEQCEKPKRKIITERDRKQYRCEYYKTHREQYAEYQRLRNINNRERRNAYAREYRKRRNQLGNPIIEKNITDVDRERWKRYNHQLERKQRIIEYRNQNKSRINARRRFMYHAKKLERGIVCYGL